MSSCQLAAEGAAENTSSHTTASMMHSTWIYMHKNITYLFPHPHTPITTMHRAKVRVGAVLFSIMLALKWVGICLSSVSRH